MREEQLIIERKNEIKRIRERNMNKIREQQLLVQARQESIMQTNQQNRKKRKKDIYEQANITSFEENLRRDFSLPIATIYQMHISGNIMFMVEEDPLEEFFIELDKIIKNEQNINIKEEQILNKMEEFRDRVNNFLIQIDEEDRETLKIYLSDYVVKMAFDSKSDCLYSKLILNPIIKMITEIEKTTSSQCCIY